MDGANNPSRHANVTLIEARPLVGRFAYLAEREVWTKPPVIRRSLLLRHPRHFR